jgi:hypothetical protein
MRYDGIGVKSMPRLSTIAATNKGYWLKIHYGQTSGLLINDVFTTNTQISVGTKINASSMCKST